MSPDALLGLIATVLVVAGLLLALRRWGRAGAEEARQEARNRGLEVEEVEREIPVSYDRWNTWEIEAGPCVRYSVPAPESDAPSWALLQRPDEHHPPLPEGWRLEPDLDALPGPVRTALAEVAGDWDEELLELEADGDAVHAYWTEWGGASGARRVEAHLRAVASAMREAG